MPQLRTSTLHHALSMETRMRPITRRGRSGDATKQPHVILSMSMSHVDVHVHVHVMCPRHQPFNSGLIRRRS